MMEKYSRQIELIGSRQQEQLHEKKVLVIGVGGLGSPTLMALAVSGVGALGLIDDDLVESSNLNRQILHDESYIGTSKTKSARHRLEKMNKDIEIYTHNERLTEEGARSIFPEYDIIVDCVDNYQTRSIVSKVATELDKTIIEGGVEGFRGYVQIIKPHETACFNCMESLNDDIYRQVLGATTGIIGNIQALECLKVLTGLWSGSYSYIAINMMDYDVDTVYMRPSEHCNCYKSHTNQH